MQTKPFRIGTRGSNLALAQAYETRDRLMLAHGLPEEMFEIVVMSTMGDRVTDRALSEIGGKGLFTEEIEQQLLSGGLDFAVHSSKDMPTLLPDGLVLAAFLAREDIRDAFIGRDVEKLMDLPHGATVGSASLRRQALLRRLRPDLNVIIYRGQVETRLRKLAEGEADATLLAYAGLKRLGRPEVATELLDQESFPPAPAQGAICIECRRNDERVMALLDAVNDRRTFEAVTCERSFLGVLDGSCRTPIAGYAFSDGEAIRFSGTVLTPDGSLYHTVEIDGKASDAKALGEQAGQNIRALAGPDFFASWLT